jgi:hypothetical protein
MSEAPVVHGAVEVAGTAALTIIEGLMLALNDRDILPESEIVGVLKDALAAHETAAKEEGAKPVHASVVVLLKTIINNGNSVRRP